MIRILHDGHACHGRHRLLEHLQPLSGEGVLEDRKAGGIAARAREACDETVSDGIGHERKYDRDCLGLRVHRRQQRGAGRHDHVWLESHEFDGGSFDGFGRIGRPAHIDLQIAAVDPAQPAQRVAERRSAQLKFCIPGVGADPGYDAPDAAALLRLRYERPARRTRESAADHRHELAAFHLLDSPRPKRPVALLTAAAYKPCVQQQWPWLNTGTRNATYMLY
jgi:hypothetical protein